MKARFIALAALVLGLASCQQEFNGVTPVGGEVDFQLQVDARELGTTRANDGDEQYGYDSAFGAIDYLCDEEDALRVDWTDVDLRYTLEVYDVADDYTGAVPVKDRMVKIVDKYEAVAFDLRLVPNRNYHFVVFADFVPQGTWERTDLSESIADQAELGLRHNIGENLGQISIKDDAINDESTDAYFATKDIVIKNSAAQGIILKRPYGKVRVIATDLHELNLNVEPKSVKVTYEAAHRAKFNAVTGTIDAEYKTCEYVYEYNNVKKTDMSEHIYTGYNTDEYKVTNANNETRNTYMTLFTDYILAEDKQTAIHFTMEVFDETGAPIKKTNFNTDIPVQRNHLTTIIGNVLTTATEINVTINDNFAARHDVNMAEIETAADLAAALTANEENIYVILGNDIDLPISSLGQQTGGSGEYKLGGENTKNITIDLNGFKLNITTTYWSGIGAKNDDARILIQNGTVTSSQATGTWNSYDVTFANCNYAIENVVFEKAIAFTNANKLVELKNVTINETHDYYAMWISAKGQTVNIDGLTIESDGRGIKIDEQYIDAPAKVTLNINDAKFTTAKKAAILVKSVAGADINASNLDITNVKQDAEFAVWVDEDSKAYADKVSVTGAYVKVEGAKSAVVANEADLKGALESDNKVVAVAEGEYTFPTASVKAGQTIICAEGTVFTGNSKLNIKGATVVGATFSNPTGNAVDQTINGTFKNCTFTGSNALRNCYAGETCVFENCVFDGKVYGVHFDGGANDVIFRNCVFSGFNAFAAKITLVTFEGCTFVGNGKSGYNGANLWGSTTLKDCEFTFNDTTANEWIDCIGADKAYSFENCTINGVGYTNDNYTEYGAIFSRNHTTIKINGVDCEM